MGQVDTLNDLLKQAIVQMSKAPGGDCDICDEHDDERRTHRVEEQVIELCRQCWKELR